MSANTAELVTAAATVFIALAAIGASLVAYVGLGTWKNQEKWGRDREIAIQVFENLRIYQTELQNMRSKSVTTQELERHFENKSLRNSDMLEFLEGMKPVYEERYERLASATRRLESAIETARFLWGADLDRSYADVLGSFGEVSSFVASHYQSVPQMEPSLGKLIGDHLESLIGIIVVGEKGSDVFEEQLRRNVEAIEADLRLRMSVHI